MTLNYELRNKVILKIIKLIVHTHDEFCILKN